MVIDKETYGLTDKNYYPVEFKKRQIVLGNSFSEKNNHIKGWLKREMGEYKKTSMFTIDRKGKIYQHFDTINYSDFTNNKSVDKKIISISIENQGWLNKDLINDTYFDWVGNIYKRRVKVIEKRWRGFNYWDPYTTKQLNSCIDLISYLCKEYNIPNKCVGHNTYIDGIEFFEGVLYKSNYYKESTDLSPAWDYKSMKNKIENKK
jgi:N-acetyl-anhydromuramyl-L-alanine amidase AmpD|tara:strand:+ start:176 stop:790 length:615 start_codon:yes stop_codon:yes gene_type:complete